MEVSIRHNRSPLFRTVYGTGAILISDENKDLVVLNFFSDIPRIPEVIQVEANEETGEHSGAVGVANMERELEVGIVMRVQDAQQFVDHLSQHLAKMTSQS